MARRSTADPAALTKASRPAGSVVLPIAITEPEWQATVAEIAKIGGWKRAHFRPARTDKGWRTPGQYEGGKGWPDLVLVHPHRQLVLFRELKSARGRLDDDQARWRKWLTEAGADYDVWTPADEELAIHVLLGPRASRR